MACASTDLQALLSEMNNILACVRFLSPSSCSAAQGVDRNFASTREFDISKLLTLEGLEVSCRKLLRKSMTSFSDARGREIPRFASLFHKADLAGTGKAARDHLCRYTLHTGVCSVQRQLLPAALLHGVLLVLGPAPTLAKRRLAAPSTISHFPWQGAAVASCQSTTHDCKLFVRTNLDKFVAVSENITQASC